ncbi:uncharacterized protein AB675_2267 [Cyphellophora attinorum]|uniref:Uncharacterized protein n=1 Tax=Cyphellophora attinorum TaxID=1664694 RepID=A0A0N0NI08_9EURO|nr:uncharacterized protein AB675_2267 [Phialophora attinorum]KPI34899.1 hypothetical protein AB675_2267 [Phialophora attinorum]
MRNLQWVLQVVELYLKTSKRHPEVRAAYERWFKSYDYQPSIAFLTKQLYRFITAFLTRAISEMDTDQEPIDEVNLYIADIFRASNSQQSSTIADCITSKEWGNINFYDGVRGLPLSTLRSFHEIRSQHANDQKSAENAAFESQDSTLLHELVHLVSYFCFDEFLAVSGLDRASLPHGLRDEHMIGDTNLSSIATPWEIAEVREFEDDRAYGITKCEHLAKLRHGALGALLNAESYEHFANQIAFEHLGGIFNSPANAKTRQREMAGVVITPPSPKIRPVTRWWAPPDVPPWKGSVALPSRHHSSMQTFGLVQLAGDGLLPTLRLESCALVWDTCDNMMRIEVRTEHIFSFMGPWHVDDISSVGYSTRTSPLAEIKFRPCALEHIKFELESRTVLNDFVMALKGLDSLRISKEGLLSTKGLRLAAAQICQEIRHSQTALASFRPSWIIGPVENMSTGMAGDPTKGLRPSGPEYQDSQDNTEAKEPDPDDDGDVFYDAREHNDSIDYEMTEDGIQLEAISST